MKKTVIIGVMTAICLLVNVVSCQADTIYVPDDYSTIQGAIDAAVNGDTVIVKPTGSPYIENIDFKGKAITVKSEQGPEVTVIDGNQNGSVVLFVSGETRNSVLQGFTITNGSGTDNGNGKYQGSAILCNYSSPTIENCIVTGNSANSGSIECQYYSFAIINNNLIYGNTNWSGGGICVRDYSQPTISNNIIRNNQADGNGGGICCFDDSSPVITDNIILQNTADYFGGGIYFYGYCNPIIVNNIIAGNEARLVSGGGLYIDHYSGATITNNTIFGNSANDCGGAIEIKLCNAAVMITNTILWKNYAPTGSQIYLNSSTDPVVTYCDVEGSWPGQGNIDSDPLFADSTNDDFHLTFNSPCKDTGDNNAPNLPDEDFEGDPRLEGAFDTVDMGADEYYRHLYYTGTAVPGGPIKLKIVGEPFTSPVKIGIGLGIQDPPQSTPHGYIYLENIIYLWDLGTIPANGIFSLGATIPNSSQPGDKYFLQAAVIDSQSSPQLQTTNPLVIEVE